MNKSSKAGLLLLFLATLGQQAGSRGLFLSPKDRATLPLVTAVGQRRFFEPRLDGDFQYGPLVDVRRANGTAQRDWSVMAAAADVRARIQPTSGPVDQRALAYAHFLLAEPSSGVALLEELAEQNADDPGLLSDLSAGYLLRAKEAGLSEDLPRSLDYAIRAVRLSPSSPRARFNLALAQTESGLLREALQSLAAIPGDDAWAAAVGEKAGEIRARLENQGLRSGLDGGVLHEEFEKALAQPETSDSDLRERARRYEEVTGDRSLRMSVADGGGQPARSPGYAAYAAGQKAYGENRIAAAMKLFREAESRLSGPFKLWATHYLAIGDYYAGDHASARARLQSILGPARSQGFKRLYARCLWMTGLLALTEGDYATALQEYGGALTGFLELHDRLGAASVRSLYAEAASWSGQRDLAWKLRVQAVAELTDARDWRREEAALVAAAILASEDGLSSATFQYHQRAVSVARAHGDQLALADVLLYGMEFGEKFGAPEALANAAELLRIRAALDPSVGRRIDAETALRLPLSLSTRPGIDMDDRLRAAERFFSGAPGSPPQLARLVDVEMRRALLAEQRGQTEAATLGFVAVAERVSRLSASMRPDERITLMETAEAALIKSLENPGPASALELAARVDTFRCRLYHNDRSCNPDTLAAARARMPEADCVLQIVPMSRRTLLIETNATDSRLAYATPSERLPRLAALTLGALESEDEPLARRRAREFGRLLFGGFSLSPGCRRVGVEAFGVAARVSPGLLWLPGERNPLGIDREVVLLTAMAAGRAVVSTAPPLIVAQARPEGFAPLPGAEAEAQKLGARLGVEVVARPLTKPEFLALLSKAGSLHFAGHSVPDPRDPLRSFLVLAGPNGRAEYVFGYEIARLNLTRLSHVVLASCHAGAGAPERRRSSLGLAGAFMAAGVQVVDAPVISVPDRATPDPRAGSGASSRSRAFASLAYAETTRRFE